MMQQVKVQVPHGMQSGQQLQFSTPDGNRFAATIPPGIGPGSSFIVQVPAPQRQPQSQPTVPMGMPVEQSQPTWPQAPTRAPIPPQPTSHATYPVPQPVPHAQPAQYPVPQPASQSQPQPMGSSMPSVPTPPVPRRGPSATSFYSDAGKRPVALRHAECPICFEPLHRGPVGVFLDEAGRRVSPHFFNLQAAEEWLRTGNGHCPLTRQSVSSVVRVPDLRTDPEGWFRTVDIDGDGRLSHIEVIECLKAQLPVDNAKLDAVASDPNHTMWKQWDKDGSGYIDRSELLADGGLISYVERVFQRHTQDEVPSISADKQAWYNYWDEDGSGSLDKEEVVRALLKTLKITQDQSRVQQMRSTIDAIWPVFDSDGSGCIERDEFLKSGDGLADTIIATMSG